MHRIVTKVPVPQVQQPVAEATKTIVNKSFKKGLLLLGCGEKTLRVIPPLIIQQKQIDEGIEILHEVLRED